MTRPELDEAGNLVWCHVCDGYTKVRTFNLFRPWRTCALCEGTGLLLRIRYPRVRMEPPFDRRQSAFETAARIHQKANERRLNHWTNKRK